MPDKVHCALAALVPAVLGALRERDRAGARAGAEDGAQPPPLLASSSVHDLEGEGEEDEVTMHEIRSKVFKMTKDKDGKAQWGDLGVGMLRLKKHKETNARRVLLRNSSTGKITIVRAFSRYVLCVWCAQSAVCLCCGGRTS